MLHHLNYNLPSIAGKLKCFQTSLVAPIKGSNSEVLLLKVEVFEVELEAMVGKIGS